MNIVCLGGGPAGLYLALSMKLRDSRHQVTVIERNRADDTFGWGVVLSDETLERLSDNDPQSAREIESNFAHWDDVMVSYNGEKHTSTGHGFCGIGRLKLLTILQERCVELGVEIRYETNFVVEDIATYQKEYDLVIGCDGLNSQVRSHFEAEFKPELDLRENSFIWLGTHKMFDAFSFIFEETEWGWFWAHAYRFDENTSTFIVECSPETWARAGIDDMEKEDGVALCQEIFAKHLDGNDLMDNAAHLRGSAAWIKFPRVTCERWYHENVVLLGDAAHTAHFSIGSGTKLAIEDAILLADLLNSSSDRETILNEYQELRALEVLKITNSARNSTTWFENVETYMHLTPLQFTYSLLTRSQRVSHENLRLRDANWLESVESWFAGTTKLDISEAGLKPMFVPYELRRMELQNRVVVSPMSMYCAKDGVPDDWHLVHYGSLAKGGAGLVYTEMTNISPEGRITNGCTGIWNTEQEQQWKKIVSFIHKHTPAKVCIQLGHSGPKGSTKLPWDGEDESLELGGWDLLGPSEVAYAPGNQVPKAMTRADMDDVLEQYIKATIRAESANFDMLELHCAHGYLLSAFITPLMNQRDDEYGGSLENRLRYPLEVFAAVRESWPDEKPLSVRISATDWFDGGITPTDAVEIAKAFKTAGVDLIDVSAGQTTPDATPVYGRMFQTPFSDRIRNEVDIPTMAVGNIFEVDHVNSILVSGRADLCCLGRPHLANPNWTMHAAAELSYENQFCSHQYGAGKAQLERNIERQKLLEQSTT